MIFIFILAMQRQSRRITVAGASDSDIDPTNGNGVNAAFCVLYIQPVSSSSSCAGGASKINRQRKKTKTVATRGIKGKLDI